MAMKKRKMPLPTYFQLLYLFRLCICYYVKIKNCRKSLRVFELEFFYKEYICQYLN